MKSLKTFLLVRNLTVIFLLQNLFRLVRMDAITAQSEVVFHNNGDALNVELQSSATDQLVQGGTNIIINVTMSYSTASPSFLSQALVVDVHLPREFNIDSVQSLRVIHLADTDYTIHSTYTTSHPSVEFQISFETITWKGFALINASVSERVVPRQLLNITGDVEYDGDSKQLWIGSYVVPGLEYPELKIDSTDFVLTPASLLTDEEQIIIAGKFLIPSVTTNIKVYMQFPVFAGSIPVSIMYAIVSTMNSSIKSANLHSKSVIGSSIIRSEIESLTPPASTLVTFEFGETVTSPGASENSVTLMVTGIVDCVGRDDVYAQGSFGNITSWLVYSTALGDETIHCSQWIETELGEPRVKYEMRFERDSGYIDGSLLIRPVFEFYNPAFATEVVSVSLVMNLDADSMVLLDHDVYVCEVPVDTYLKCQNASLWPMLSITNTTTSIHVDITNLNVGYGVRGDFQCTILRSVPAGQDLESEMSLQYQRPRWTSDSSTVFYKIKTQRILLTISVFSSSVESGSELDAAIGEKLTCRVSGLVPVTTNADFSIRVIVGDQMSVSYDQATIIYVGENIEGLQNGTELNVTSEGSPIIPKNTQVFFAYFGTVRNNVNSTDADASTFVLEVSFSIINMDDNANDKTFTFTPLVFHSPNFRKSSQPSLTFEIVEPALTGSLSVTPSKNVSENTELSFTLTISIDSASTSTAFNLAVLLTIPSPHMNLTEYSSTAGTLRTVPGNESPKQLLRSEDINSTILVYEIDEVTLSTTVINCKTRTSETLAASIVIIPSFVMFYSSLPKNLNQSLAREYSYIPDSQPIIFTFRTDSFLNLSLSHNERQVDTDDVLNITITVRNVGVGGVSPTAYDMKMIMSLSKTLFRNTSIICNQGSFGKNTSSEFDTMMAETATIMYEDDELKCNVEATLNAAVIHLRRIELTSTLTYHGLPTTYQHEYERYSSESETFITVKELGTNMQLSGSGNMSQVLYNSTLKYTAEIIVPEGTTTVRVDLEVPTIGGYRRRRRSARRKRATEIKVLVPDISQTSYVFGDNLVIGSMNHFFVNNIYTLEFKNITNQPDNIDSESDILTIVVTFLVTNEPGLLVGRSFNLTSTFHYSGGSIVQTSMFTVIGNFSAPVLQINKSFEVLDASLESPSGIFFVNISHAPDSHSDAYDVNITDFIEGMDVIRDDEFPGIVISSPSNNVYQISANIPRITHGTTVYFYYKAKFKIKVKSPKYIQKRASVTWRGSVQPNSPIYGPIVNSDVCVARNDTVYGSVELKCRCCFVCFAFLGFLLGFLLILICVCVFIQCCREGRLVPYYRMFVSQAPYSTLNEDVYEERSFYTTPVSRSEKDSWLQLFTLHNIFGNRGQPESIVYSISSDDPKKAENELNKLNIQEAQRLDDRVENSSQLMFIKAFEHLLLSLHKKDNISEDEVDLYTKELHASVEEITARNHLEYRKRIEDLRRKMQLKGESEMKELDERRRGEIEEATTKLKNANEKETLEVVDLIIARYQSLETRLRAHIQLEHDVEREKFRKEVSVDTRLSCKEIQRNLLNAVLTKAEVDQEEAELIISQYFSTIAGVEKMHNAEKSRQAMALEMRLEERKALAQQVRDEREQEALLLAAIKDKHSDDVETLLNSLQISEAKAGNFRKKMLKDGEILHKKLEKQRKRKEQNLHNSLTHLKRKKLQENEEKYQMDLKALEEANNDSADVKDAMLERHELTQRCNLATEETERELDQHVVQDLRDLRRRYAEEARARYRDRIKKWHKELIKKGAKPEHCCQLLSTYDAELTKILGNQEVEQNEKKIALKEQLNKKREIVAEKVRAEQIRQEANREKEAFILKNVIHNQVVISEEEREKVLREHEQSMARLESSLTLDKLRQKQLMQNETEKQRATMIAILEQTHENENRETVDDGKDISNLVKKHETEKLQVIGNDAKFEKEPDEICDEMSESERKTIQRPNDRLGAHIVGLQIKRGNQNAVIHKQLRVLDLLQSAILDELDEKGVLSDPETSEILEKHETQSQKMENTLRIRHDEQEKALKKRLNRRVEQKGQDLSEEQKDELKRYINELESSKAETKLRKATLKAKHKKYSEMKKEELEREVEQSVNEMKFRFEMNRLKAVEKQNIQTISALVKCGRIREEDLDAVLNVICPTKKPEARIRLLSQIYGSTSSRPLWDSSQPGRPGARRSLKHSSLELKVLAQMNPTSSNKNARQVKPRYLDHLPSSKAVSSNATKDTSSKTDTNKLGKKRQLTSLQK